MIILFFICILSVGCSKKVSNDNIIEDTEEGKLMVFVIDKTTKAPIKDVSIRILGDTLSYITNEKGLSSEITMNINKDIYKKYGSELYKKAPSGSCSVLLTKEGYKDYLVVNKQVYPGFSDNILKVELTKSSNSDKEKYNVDYQYPHEVWIQNLVDYCNEIKVNSEGNNEYKVNIVVKNQNSKPVQNALIYIPELKLRTQTDENGKAVLKPDNLVNTININNSIKNEAQDYTLIVNKENYKSAIIFNIKAPVDKDNNIGISLVEVKDNNQEKYTIGYQAYEQEVIDNFIKNLKQNN